MFEVPGGRSLGPNRSSVSHCDPSKWLWRIVPALVEDERAHDRIVVAKRRRDPVTRRVGCIDWQVVRKGLHRDVHVTLRVEDERERNAGVSRDAGGSLVLPA